MPLLTNHNGRGNSRRDGMSISKPCPPRQGGNGGGFPSGAIRRAFFENNLKERLFVTVLLENGGCA
jgi:hypothetical protein